MERSIKYKLKSTNWQSPLSMWREWWAGTTSVILGASSIIALSFGDQPFPVWSSLAIGAIVIPPGISWGGTALRRVRQYPQQAEIASVLVEELAAEKGMLNSVGGMLRDVMSHLIVVEVTNAIVHDSSAALILGNVSNAARLDSTILVVNRITWEPLGEFRFGPTTPAGLLAYAVSIRPDQSLWWTRIVDDARIQRFTAGNAVAVIIPGESSDEQKTNHGQGRTNLE